MGGKGERSITPPGGGAVGETAESGYRRRRELMCGALVSR